MRSELYQLGAVALGLACGLTAVIPSARGDAKPSTIGIDEIHEGMKGWGLTVIRGTDPEKFNVEVVGILHNFRPSQALIFVRVSHPRLDVTKNVKGMSGSPIFFDGRLAGAYAYSWSQFQVEPIAGVTPIAPMLVELHRPMPPGFWPLDGNAPLPANAHPATRGERHATRTGNSFDGEPGSYDLAAHASQLAARYSQPADASHPLIPTATPIMLGGVGDRTAAWLHHTLDPLGLEVMQAGGGGGQRPDASAPQHFVDGGTLGVSMVSGDVSFFGLGTVTHVEGTKLAGFGHPMMESGDTAMPTSLGRILFIWASDQHSVKIGEEIRPLGTMIEDRMAAVVIDETKVAPVFGVDVTVKGVPNALKLHWHSNVSEDKFMGPQLAAAVLGSVVEATSNERRDVTWHLQSKLTVRGHGTITLDDFGVAAGGMPDAGDFSRSRIARAIGDVLNNPWENARVESVESELTLDYAREVLRLRGLELLDPIVDAGQTARIRAHLFPLHGPETIRVLDVRVPAELAGRDVDIDVEPGFDVVPELAAPESLDELLANSTRQSALPKSLVAQIKVVQQGVAYHNHVAERLPSFALDALRPVNADTGPDAIPSYVRVTVPLDDYVDGHDKVKVHVRAPVR